MFFSGGAIPKAKEPLPLAPDPDLLESQYNFENIQIQSSDLLGLESEISTAPSYLAIFFCRACQLNLLRRRAAIARPPKKSSGTIIWDITAISLTLGSAWMSYSAVTSYSTLAEENKSLSTQYKNSNDSTERSRLQSEYDANSVEMISLKSSIQTYDLLTLLGASWEAYLFFSSDSRSARIGSNKHSRSTEKPQFALKSSAQGRKATLAWNWSF